MREAWSMGREMAVFLDENNGRFTGNFSNTFAISHGQIAEVRDPLNLFVVAKEMAGYGTGRTNRENCYFPGRIIFNAKILETPKEIMMDFPTRTLDCVKGGIATFKQGVERKNTSNMQWLEEACMSFPLKNSRKMERYFRIKVRYWYFTPHGIPLRKTEWVEGLKAHIFQHECDHFDANPIYYRTKKV